jgi:hypothetical protein
VHHGTYGTQYAAKEHVDTAYAMSVLNGHELNWEFSTNPYTKLGVVLSAFDGTCTTTYYIIEVEEPNDYHQSLEVRINEGVKHATHHAVVPE